MKTGHGIHPAIRLEGSRDFINLLWDFSILVGKEFAFSVGDPGLISGLGISPEEADSSPLQYSCLENSVDRGT